MTPGARIATAIDLLSVLEAPDAPPADKLLADWARGNRYAGSKDKSAIATMVYGTLRRRGQIDWWLSRTQGDEPGARSRLLIWLQLGEGWGLERLKEAMTGQRHDASPLSAKEARVAIELSQQRGFELGCQPAAAAGNLPDFLGEVLTDLYGEDAARQAAAHNMEAPVDLRANSLKTDRQTLQQFLAKDGIASTPTPLAPLGLRLEGRKPLTGTKAFKEGLFEPQDEGSQLASLLVEADPGMKVVDFCAGAGGKALALGARMENHGRIIACDVSEARLNRAAQRLKRAGVFMVERRVLSTERDKWIKRRAARFDGGFDRVLVDAPCTGSGTWRRNPDQKWKLTAEGVAELNALQSSIIDSAARLVLPGGRLIYVTCSFLPSENEDVVTKFLADRPDFFAHPLAEIWEKLLPDIPYPGKAGSTGLRLTPADHGTDGFFIAVLGRKLTTG